jgi:hypothetical protein
LQFQTEKFTQERRLCCFAEGCIAHFTQVRWSDDYPSSWEPEDFVSQDLIAAFAQKNPHLFELPPPSGEGQEEAQREKEAVGV